MERHAGSDDVAQERPIRQRILEAAFQAFSDKGYASASTLAIATDAKVSKRDLYANFGSKHDMLVACIEGRAAKMNLAEKMPRAASIAELEVILAKVGAKVLVEVSDPMIVAVFRLAIAEATRSPEIGKMLEKAGRQTLRRALKQLMSDAQEDSLLEAGDAGQFAEHHLALLWEGLWTDLLLGLMPTPSKRVLDGQAKRAARSFLALHGRSPAKS